MNSDSLQSLWPEQDPGRAQTVLLLAGSCSAVSQALLACSFAFVLHKAAHDRVTAKNEGGAAGSAHFARAAPRRVRNLSGVVLLAARPPGVPLPPGLLLLPCDSGSSGRRGFSRLPVDLAAVLRCCRSCACVHTRLTSLCSPAGGVQQLCRLNTRRRSHTRERGDCRRRATAVSCLASSRQGTGVSPAPMWQATPRSRRQACPRSAVLAWRPWASP